MKIILVLLLLLGGFNPAWAVAPVSEAPPAPAPVSEDACEMYPDIPVNVTPRFDNPAYNFGASIAQIQSLSGDSHHSIREGITLGLTRYEPVVEFRVPVKGIQFSDGLACARVDHVDVSIGYRNVTVLIANEIPQKTCGFDQVMAHEQKHIAVNEGILQEYVPRIQERLKNYLKLNGVFREENPDYALSVLHEKLQDILDDIAEDISKENQRRQELVDTPEEYQRLTMSCHGQLAEIGAHYKMSGH